MSFHLRPVVAAVLQLVAASASAQPYRSAFEGYRPFNDQAVGSWREANELVGRIGGWQTYLREGQGEAAAASPSSAPAKGAPAPTKPAASAAGGHSGHKMP